MPRALPAQNQPVIGPDGRATVPWYGWFDSLRQRAFTLTDNKILFSDNGSIAEATVGAGLTLNRTTNTLSADGFDDAPADGNTYGRRNNAWTLVSGVPGAPDTAVQFNQGGIFGGSPLFTWNYATAALNVNGDMSLGGSTSNDRVVWDKSANTLTFNSPSAMIIDSGTLFSGAADFYIQGLSVGANAAYLKVYASPSGSATTAGFACFNEPVGTVDYQLAAYQIDNTSAAFSSFAEGASAAYPFTWGFSVANYHNIMYPSGNLRLLAAAQAAPLPADSGFKLDVGGTGKFSGKVTFATPGASAASINLPHGSAPSVPVNGDLWTTTSGAFAFINGATVQFGNALVAGSNTQIQYNNSGALGASANLTWTNGSSTFATVNGTFTGLLLTAASGTGGAGFRLPHGAAPSSPTNGDLWTTTAGLYARINGATVGPFVDSAGTGAPADAQYVTLATNGTLTNERVLTAGTGISITDGGAGGNVTIANTASAAFSPADIPSLAAWWDAEDLAAYLSNGSNVNQWANRVSEAGFENLLVQNLPTFQTNVINGLPVVRFNGTSNWLSCTNQRLTSSNVNREMTFFVVAKPDSATAGTRGLLGKAQTNQYEYQLDVPSSTVGTSFVMYQLAGGSYANVGAYGSNPTAAAACIVTAQFVAGVRAYAWRDGGAKISTTTFSGSQTTGTSVFAVGQRGDSNASNFFDGDIAAILVFTRNLTFSEIDQVNSYLATRYAVTVTNVS